MRRALDVAFFGESWSNAIAEGHDEIQKIEELTYDDMRGMIHDGNSEQDLERHARASSGSIRADGRRKVL